MSQLKSPSATAIETVSGRYVDLVSPDPDNIIIDDIAWSLSREPRYVCHNINHDPYTVGQHSLLVSSRIKDYLTSSDNGVDELDLTKMMLLGLLHDASEAYTGDIPRPFKRILDLRSPVARMEERLQDSIYTAISRTYGIPKNFFRMTELEHNVLKDADTWALQLESYNLMRSRGNLWLFDFNQNVKVTDKDLASGLQIFSRAYIYRTFLDRFEILKNHALNRNNNKRGSTEGDGGQEQRT